MELTTLLRLLVRRWRIVLLGAIISLCVTGWVIHRVGPEYVARSYVLFVPPATATPGGNPLLDLGGLQSSVDVVSKSLVDERGLAEIRKRGGTAEIETAIDTSTSGPVLSITTTANSAATAAATGRVATQLVNPTLDRLQEEIGIPPRARILAQPIVPDPDARMNRNKQIRAGVIMAGAGALSTFFVAALLEAWSMRARPRPDSPLTPESHPAQGAAVWARFGGLRTLDARTLLTMYLLLLLFIPSSLVVSSIGGTGTPAAIFSIGLFVWVILDRARQVATPPLVSLPSLRWLGFFLAACVASYVAATSRPVSAEELRSSQMGFIALVGWIGVAVAVARGVRTQLDLDVLLRRFSVIGGVVALLVLAQFVTERPWVDLISIPGLSSNVPIASQVAARSGFVRPSGTAIHPIELGVVLATSLPFALHGAVHGQWPGFLRRWWPALAILAALGISMSRSTVLSILVVLVILMPAWRPELRRRAIVGLTAGMLLLYFTLPGFLSTLLGLFAGLSNDSSAQSRVDSYGIAFDFFRHSPIFGRGFLTFLPRYRILDNQYLGLLIDVGIVGLLALLMVFASSLVMMARIVKQAPNAMERHGSLACAASVAAGALASALFDILSFPMAAGVLFFSVGVCGARYSIALGDGVGKRSEGGVEQADAQPWPSDLPAIGSEGSA